LPGDPEVCGECTSKSVANELGLHEHTVGKWRRSAIESCRTAAVGGNVARCQDCAYTTITYNSCCNRHCPKCQGAAAKEWLAEREAELLPVPYFHVVFTLPAAIADIAYQNSR
jgi:transposase-like protein